VKKSKRILAGKQRQDGSAVSQPRAEGGTPKVVDGREEAMDLVT
jgi:hypothetical protein